MDEKKLFDNFHQCFGRFMTPFEIEDIQKWIHVDNTPIEVVNMALKEAVVNDKINWKYINKILINWHKAGDNTIEKVQARLEAFELKKQQGSQKQTGSNIPKWSNPNYQETDISALKIDPSEVKDEPGAF
ncbi:DnaD domain-containing protein [Streptococcus parauberis]|uniref:DnaD domain-containing protein n=1 Tax=Streptococcus parauberis TaxID=1348 RepID=UPI0021A2FFBB|nr:DnaD domain protein [Streptococcus parauberis]UWM90215.1 DnaD domain protein [Streptococcus parauberis]